MAGGINLPDKLMVVHAFGPLTPSTTVGDYISLKHAKSCEIVITALNGSTVTGSAITINQAQAVAGTNAKALAFSRYYTNVDPVNSAVMTNATAASNTFTTATTNSIKIVHRIPIDPATLDSANGFDCIAVAAATAANTTLSCVYHIEPKLGGNAANFPNVVLD